MNGINRERRQVWIKQFPFGSKKGYFHGFIIRDQGIGACKTPGKWETPYGIIEFEDGVIELLEPERWNFADTKNFMNEEMWLEGGDDDCPGQVSKDSSDNN